MDKEQSIIQRVPLDGTVELYIKREDLLHPHISGNKFRKLKYNIEAAKQQEQKTLLTFGGAFSNHIVATAYAGKYYGFETIGIIRGEELAQNDLNTSLAFAKSCGMELVFVDRVTYKERHNEIYIEDLRKQYTNFYLIPEGGTNALAVKGCKEILNSEAAQFDYICCSVGTGGTLSGLIEASEAHQNILGFSALKGDFLKHDIRKFVTKINWHLVTDYHFGGYAKINEELVTFINRFKSQYNIPLDPIYTGKMLFGIMQMIENNEFESNAKILAVHTGGLQGITGMNARLHKKQMPLITI